MISKFFKNSLAKSYAYAPQRFFASTKPIEDDSVNAATAQLFESVSSTLKGITHVNYVVEHQQLTEEEKAGKKRFLIYRYNPNVRRILII